MTQSAYFNIKHTVCGMRMFLSSHPFLIEGPVFCRHVPLSLHYRDQDVWGLKGLGYQSWGANWEVGLWDGTKSAEQEHKVIWDTLVSCRFKDIWSFRFSGSYSVLQLIMDGERYLNLLSNLEIFWVDIHQIRFIRNSFFTTVLSNFVRRCLEICCIRAWWVTLQMWKSWTLTVPTCLPFFSLLACLPENVSRDIMQ